MAKVKNPTRPLAVVNVLPQADGQNKIVVCIMPDPAALAGERESRAAIGLDASLSIKEWFGTPGPFGGGTNYVQPVARKLGEILCGVTRDGKTNLFYWALGPGDEFEEIGTFGVKEMASADVSGPKKHVWGKGTRLLPAVQHVVETVGVGAAWVMGIIVTDGVIDDEPECMEYCRNLGQWLRENSHVTMKLVLIGLGPQVDASQLVRFDDMFEGTELENDIDLWSHGLVLDIKDDEEIVGVVFGELMSEKIIVAPEGKVLDAGGNVVVRFSDGLPGKFQFLLPKGCRSFTLQAGGQEVVQDISSVL
ncbi:MAG: hypothetical protein NTV86_00110 [Planctomycetota bacterium]|nr:hypothetical protein [Planctomycetota bacterium]